MNKIYLKENQKIIDQNGKEFLTVEGDFIKLEEASKGIGLKPGEYFYVSDMLKIADRDNYKTGTDPSSSITDAYKINKKFSSFSELTDYFMKNYLTNQINNWGIFGDEDGRIKVQQYENDGGEEANQKELKEWKAGLIDLWLCNYSIYVEIMSNGRAPTSDELIEITGLQEI